MRQLHESEMASVSGGISLLDIVVTWVVDKTLDAAYDYVTDVQPVDLADPAIPANVYGA